MVTNRFLFDIHYPTFGGPHNQALQLAKPLLQRGWSTTVLLPTESGNALGRLNAAGVSVIQEHLYRLRATRDVRVHAQFIRAMKGEISLMRRLIREQEFNVVVIAGLYTVQTAIAARLEGTPVVWQILDTVAPAGVRRALMPIVVRCADCVMTTGIEVARQHPGALKLDERLVPYYPPVDTAHFRPDPTSRAVARSMLGIPQDAILVGTVGNLNRTKGHQYLVEAAREIIKTNSKVYFRILGAFTPTHREYACDVMAAINRYDLASGGRFEIVDPAGGVRDLLPALDLFVSTSIPRSEGVPTAILEAMATGVPVVATAVGGVTEAIEDGVSGIIVPPLDVGAVVRAIDFLLSNPQLRVEMGHFARERAVSKFDIASCVDSHLSAFELAMARRSRPR